jgi:hypothetical protein
MRESMREGESGREAFALWGMDLVSVSASLGRHLIVRWEGLSAGAA